MMTDGMFSRLSWLAVGIILRTLYNYPVIKHNSVLRQPQGGDLPMPWLLCLYVQALRAVCCCHTKLHPRKQVQRKCCLNSGFCNTYNELSECFNLQLWSFQHGYFNFGIMLCCCCWRKDSGSNYPNNLEQAFIPLMVDWLIMDPVDVSGLVK